MTTREHLLSRLDRLREVNEQGGPGSRKEARQLLIELYWLVKQAQDLEQNLD